MVKTLPYVFSHNRFVDIIVSVDLVVDLIVFLMSMTRSMIRSKKNETIFNDEVNEKQFDH